MTVQTFQTLPPPDAEELLYPESDGKPIADNTIQFRHIVMVQGGLDNQFRGDPNVLVVGDLLWYPVRGHPEISAAPDAMVVFGRPRGDRRSYLQWREGNLAPQVAFEILSHNNTAAEMEHKLEFYQRYGVEEYYVYDPYDLTLTGYRRVGDELQEIADLANWVSPRLGIRFDLSGTEHWVIGPDGQPFQFYLDVTAERDHERRQRRRAEAAGKRAETAKKKAEAGKKRAETGKKKAEADKKKAEAEAQRLAEKLRALGIDPDA